jgi:tetratricopeptide (TPR) repeat protein
MIGMNGDTERVVVMDNEMVTFEIKIDDFDFEILPLKIDIELLKGNKNLREKAIRLFYEDHLLEIGGEVKTEIVDAFIKVRWWPVSSGDIDKAIEFSIDLLQKGAYGHAEPILEALVDRHPERPDILFNYGMMLSDQGKMDKAIDLLLKLTTIETDNANAWNALGVAYMRNQQANLAKKALLRSYKIDPENGYTLRNLAVVTVKDNQSEALPFFEKAAELLPNDQQAQYGYALYLLENGEPQKADLVFIQAIEISPYSEISEKCRIKRTEIAQKIMRDNAPGELRMDVVMYCLSALEKIQTLGLKRFMTITAEISLLGRSGLDINDPEKRYKLKSIDGEFTGLQLVSYMYVGIKKMDKNLDAGIDFSKEYSMAQGLFDNKNR